MAYTSVYAEREPARAEVDGFAGASLLEFGAPWCGHCISAQGAIRTALDARPGLRHLKVEDGSGRPLGRSFRIKLWPTLVLVRDGEELGRVVRPQDAVDVERLLAPLDGDGGRAGTADG